MIKPRWDFYTATFQDVEADELRSAWREAYPQAEIVPAMPKHGWLRGFKVEHGILELATVWSDGNPWARCHAFAAGRQAVEFEAFVRARWAHRYHVTRADSCLDMC